MNSHKRRHNSMLGCTQCWMMQIVNDTHTCRKTQGQVTEAVDALLNLEKAQRLAEDVGGTRRACQAILEVPCALT